MPAADRQSPILRLADLPARKATRFALGPDAAGRGALAGTLGLLAIDALDFRGEIRPSGRQDWELEATLVAEVVQPCVVTLAPVATRLEETVRRRYLADYVEPEVEETEMPEDDEAEPLPATIDLAALMAEALALALPPYPRAEGAEFGTAAFAAPGVEPLDDEAVKPFAGLAGMIGTGPRRG